MTSKESCHMLEIIIQGKLKEMEFIIADGHEVCRVNSKRNWNN